MVFIVCHVDGHAGHLFMRPIGDMQVVMEEQKARAGLKFEDHEVQLP